MGCCFASNDFSHLFDDCARVRVWQGTTAQWISSRITTIHDVPPCQRHIKYSRCVCVCVCVVIIAQAKALFITRKRIRCNSHSANNSMQKNIQHKLCNKWRRETYFALSLSSVLVRECLLCAPNECGYFIDFVISVSIKSCKWTKKKKKKARRSQQTNCKKKLIFFLLFRFFFYRWGIKIFFLWNVAFFVWKKKDRNKIQNALEECKLKTKKKKSKNGSMWI